MNTPTIGFTVLYRWRVRNDMEDRFRKAWETVTLALRAQRGALGSRLHREEDGLWVAYAQWPDKGAWERSRELDPVDPAAAAVMGEAITESLPPILMIPVSDHLVHD